MPVQQAVYEPLPLPDVASDGAWSPQIDVRELPDEYIVLVDLPGVEPEAVHVSSEKDRLTIEGARRDRLHASGVPYRLERPTGKLRRSVLLPGPHDRTQIRTRIRDGVLEIRIPKRDDVGLTREFRVEEQPIFTSTCSATGSDVALSRSVLVVARREQPRRMFAAQDRQMPVPLARLERHRRRGRDLPLGDSEAPTEAEDRTGLVRLGDEREEAMRHPFQIGPRLARRRVEQRWCEAKPAEGVRQRAERLEGVHLELEATARAVGRANELDPAERRGVAAPGVGDGGGADRETASERSAAEGFWFVVWDDGDLHAPAVLAQIELQAHRGVKGVHPARRQVPIWMRM